MLAELVHRQVQRDGHLFHQTVGGAAIGGGTEIRERAEDALGERDLDRHHRHLIWFAQRRKGRCGTAHRDARRRRWRGGHRRRRGEVILENVERVGGPRGGRRGGRYVP